MDLIDFTDNNNIKDINLEYPKVVPNEETQSQPSVRPKIRAQSRGFGELKVVTEPSVRPKIKSNINLLNDCIEVSQMFVEECMRSPQMNNSGHTNEESDPRNTPFRAPKTDHKLRIAQKKRLSLKSEDINGNHFFKSEDNMNVCKALFETTIEDKMIKQNDCKSCDQNKCQMSSLDSIQPNSQPFRGLRRPLRANISINSEQKVVALRRPKRSVNHYLAQFF